MRSFSQLILIAGTVLASTATMAIGQEKDTITSFEELSSYMGLVDRDKLVDATTVVNFSDVANSTLFVQKGSLGCYVDITQAEPAPLPEFALGDRVRIKGLFVGSRDCVVADSITLIQHGPPVKAVNLDIDRLGPKSNWSDRVSLSGTVEQFVQSDEGIVLTVRGQVQYFLVRVAHDQQFDRLSQLVGSNVTATGCLDWIADEYGVRSIPMCLLMTGADIVGDPSPQTSVAVRQLALKKLGYYASEQGQTVETVGIVSEVINRGLLLLESHDGGGVLVRSSSLHSLDVGDVVQVVGVLSLSDGHPTIVASRLRKQMASVPVPPTHTSAKHIIASDLPLTRVSISGELTSLSSRGRMRSLNLTDEGINFTARIILNDAEFDSIDLQRASRVKVQGALLKPTVPEEAFVIYGRGVDAVTVSKAWVTFDETRVRLLAASVILCLLLGAGMIWLLRSQVRRKTQALRDMTAQLSSAFDAVQEGLLILDRSGTVLSWNDRMARLFDLDSSIARGPELVNHLARRLAEPDKFLTMWNSLPASSQETYGSTLKTCDEGAYTAYSSPIFSGDDKQQVAGRLWSFEDVSERSQLEAKLVQSQKMEAVGRLAGGIAHDFNNLLMGISGNLELMRAGDANDQGPSLTAAEKATDRATRLVERLLSFSRQSPVRLVPMTPNSIVRSVGELASQKLSEQLHFDLADDESVWLVDVDELQLEQVLLNLCLNASDALVDEKGSISVRTENVVDAALGECVCISVIDSGTGMSETVTAKIFEPFFTTKDIDKGTGLGLAMSYGIVNQHNGRIDVESKVGFGSRFDIVLPRSKHLKSNVAKPVPEIHGPIDALDNALVANTHILIADDEEIVRDAAARMLTGAGYTVFTASNGVEVLELLSQNTHIDMLVLDLTMPTLSGRETLLRVSDRYPNLPVLLCTGHLMDSDLSMLSTRSLVDVITKPFRARTLLKSVELGLREPLGASEPSSLESA
jgi:signal transduction histidine kinase